MLDVADIFRAVWPGYAAKFGRLIPPEQRAAARAILRCRTPALGGQLYRCDCGQAHYTYHSCNHRACPKCGYDDNAQWLAKQQTRLLPVPYFLVTFTVPEQLREPIRSSMKLWYGALLRQSAGALQDVAAQEKYLGAQLGLVAVLQTWTRDLRYHPHVHLLVPGAGLSPDGLHWKRLQDPDYFLPQNKLAARLKGRLKAWLSQEHPPTAGSSAPQNLVDEMGRGRASGGQRRRSLEISGRLCQPRPAPSLTHPILGWICQRRNERGESRRFENPFSSEAFSSITSV
jgi:hypothetical protein